MNIWFMIALVVIMLELEAIVFIKKKVRSQLEDILQAIKTSTEISNQNEKVLNLLLTDYIQKGNDNVK